MATPESRMPLLDFGSEGVGDLPTRGYIKCKLAHGLGYSIILPDVLLLGAAGNKWIQPLTFSPNMLSKFGDEIRHTMSVDISCGHRLLVNFRKGDIVSRLADGAELYQCTFKGTADLEDYATGDSFLSTENVPYLRLFHHTSSDAKQKILASGELWGSKWNIQGTSKTLTNAAYVYFTSLDAVETVDDLNLIAMAGDGKLSFLVDNFAPPVIPAPGWEKASESKILILPVYRASTADRNVALHFDVESTLPAPQHLPRHSPEGEGVWYEIATPFVQRVGISPGTTLQFPGPRISFDSGAVKHFDYVVIGDATTVEGLAAPYDEEDTTFVLKIERPHVDSNILDFWFEHGNQDIFGNKTVETQTFG
jgi:hypothetical protein